MSPVRWAFSSVIISKPAGPKVASGVFLRLASAPLFLVTVHLPDHLVSLLTMEPLGGSYPGSSHHRRVELPPVDSFEEDDDYSNDEEGSQFGFSSTKDQDSIAKQETQAVNRSRALAYSLICVAAITMGIVTYYAVAKDENDEFESEVCLVPAWGSLSSLLFSKG